LGALIEHHVTAAWKTGLLEDRNLYDEVWLPNCAPDPACQACR
jgi:hypothetical protein